MHPVRYFRDEIFEISSEKHSNFRISNGMQEELKKNFVLLSAVAKEKKYAQEYLGLLARRGDIGSIRIGKRWYTTWQWFEEFLENSQKKKEEVVEQVLEAEKVEPEVIQPAEEKIPVPATLPIREEPVVIRAEKKEVNVASENKLDIKSEGDIFKVKISVPQVRIANPMPLRIDSKPEEKINIRNIVQEQEKFITVRKKESAPVINIRVENTLKKEIPKKMIFSPPPKKEIDERKYIPAAALGKKQDPVTASPDFSIRELPRRSVFSKFAFSAGFAIMILLLAASAYLAYSGNFFDGGKVAGASNSRDGGLEGIKSEGGYFIDSTSGKIKESFSISGIVIETAISRQKKNTK